MGSNCIASTSIGCLWCCRRCDAEKLRNAFTFIPPPSSYTVEESEEDESKGRLTYLIDGLRNSPPYLQAARSSEVQWVTNRKGARVPLIWVRKWKRGDSDPFVLLHCHGNATDIGLMMLPYYDLARVLGIEVLGVEYSGYGTATGTPSAESTYADVEAAYDFLVAQGIPPGRIIAYGQSVGSGPVSMLAATHPIGGLVLHSPLLSGIRVVDPQPNSCCKPSCVWRCFDFYPNEKRMRKVSCPVLVMHGRRDDIIPFYHGQRLVAALPERHRWPPYFPERAGHNDLVETDAQGYFAQVSNFLEDVRRIAGGETVVPPTPDRPEQVTMGAPSSSSVVGGQGLRSDEIADKPAMQTMSSSKSSDKNKEPDLVPVVCTQVEQVAAGETEDQAAGPSRSTASGSRPAPAKQEPQGVPAGGTREVRAGPEDGRYDQIRKGNVAVLGRLANYEVSAPAAEPAPSHPGLHSPETADQWQSL